MKTNDTPARFPVATCRIQLRNDIGFADVEDRLEYLAALGISHVYLSPIFLAQTTSTHGYDCVDPNLIDPLLGGETGFRSLCAAASRLNLGIVLDIVPNHLGVGWDNPYWRSMLRDGAASASATLFDVDWEALAGGTPGQILLPLLGRPLTEVIAAGELRLEAASPATDDGPVARYFEHCLPLAPDSLDPDIDTTLARQHWRLASWRCGNSMLNWRRFFDITELAGIRVEEVSVFAETHRKLIELLAIDAVQGLRIDHVDGLADPGEYLRRLDATWRAHRADEPWLLVEKILAPDEQLPSDWPVAGTTGYEALNRILAVFIDPAGLDAIDAAWRDFGGNVDNFTQELARAKREILTQNLAAELARLTRALSADQRLDFPLDTIREGLIRLVIATDRYRSYGAAAPGAFDAAAGRADWSGLEEGLPAALIAAMPPESSVRRRFEQLSAPAMAKALEDTTFYRWFPLLARNEVGNEPGAPLPSIASLHDLFAESARASPRGLLATTTHDTKRGEDGRIRLALLSHAGAQWREEAAAWLRLAESHRVDSLPDLKTVYFIFQTFVSAWPVGAESSLQSQASTGNAQPANQHAAQGAAQPAAPAAVERAVQRADLPDRLAEYFEKALREGKRGTSWLEPDTRFETKLQGFVAACLADEALAGRIHDYVRRLDRAARALALGQTVLKLTLPGIPDIYHGSERQDLSLVDPDNRRPVDLANLIDRLIRPPGQWWEPGAKQSVIRTILNFRKNHRELLAAGSYRVLPAGDDNAPVFAFERSLDDARLVVIVLHRVSVPYGESALPQERIKLTEDDGNRPITWFDVLNGKDRMLDAAPMIADLLDGWPVAVLFRDGTKSRYP